MDNKTCGECRYYEHPAGQCAKVVEYNNCHITDKACEYFEPKVITNGDVIRQMGNRELVGFVDCSACIYAGHDCANQNCTEGKLAWLNAPAESEGEDE